MRDFQRSKVYRWERAQSFWDEAAPDANPPTLTLAACENLVARVAKRYCVPTIRVTDGRGSRNARGSSRRVALPLWARTAPVVLHEAAHAIDAARGIHDKHGPIFVRLFIQLVATYMGKDEAALVQSAKKFGLRVAGHQPVRAPASRFYPL